MLGRDTQPNAIPSTGCGTRAASSSREEVRLGAARRICTLCVCNSGEVMLALSSHGFAGVTCSQLFIQAAIPCVAHGRRKGVLEHPLSTSGLLQRPDLGTWGLWFVSLRCEEAADSRRGKLPQMLPLP